MSLLNKLESTTLNKFPGKKPTGPQNPDSSTHALGTYQDYLVDVAGQTSETNDDTAFVDRSTPRG